jgi:hypothetical protein
MAIPSNIKWGTLWILIGITGLVLVFTGHGIGITIYSKDCPPDGVTYPLKVPDLIDNYQGDSQNEK